MWIKAHTVPFSIQKNIRNLVYRLEQLILAYIYGDMTTYSTAWFI